MRRGLLGVLAALGLAGVARGQDPVPPPPVAAVIVPGPESYFPLGTGFYRADPYAVWQDYAPDRGGRWKPRVVYTEAGIYYHYSGMPYRFASVNQRYFMTYATD